MAKPEEQSRQKWEREKPKSIGNLLARRRLQVDLQVDYTLGAIHESFRAEHAGTATDLHRNILAAFKGEVDELWYLQTRADALRGGRMGPRERRTVRS